VLWGWAVQMPPLHTACQQPAQQQQQQQPAISRSSSRCQQVRARCGAGLCRCHRCTQLVSNLHSSSSSSTFQQVCACCGAGAGAPAHSQTEPQQRSAPGLCWPCVVAAAAKTPSRCSTADAAQQQVSVCNTKPTATQTNQPLQRPKKSQHTAEQSPSNAAHLACAGPVWWRQAAILSQHPADAAQQDLKPNNTKYALTYH
jgi:hypothetical protein